MCSRWRMPARVALDPLVLAAGQADQVEQLADRRLLLARRHAVQLGEVAQVVRARTAARRGPGRRRRRSRSAGDLAGVVDHVVPEHAGRARGRQQQGDQHLDGGGLAGAVRPQQPEQLAALDREVDAADRVRPRRLAPEKPVWVR